jgi:hypothetical protein
VICYRFAAYATPLRTIVAAQPARFHRGDEDEPTQYLSLHPLGPLAELMRNAELRSSGQLRAVRTRTWALEVPLEGMPDVTFDTAVQFGLTAEALVADDHSACQELAARLRTQIAGVLVPSAALPGTRNVVLFGPRVAAPYLTSPVSALDIPASITSDHGRPLRSLLDLVRFRGEAHPALDAWEQGTTFRFVEPNWSLTPTS